MIQMESLNWNWTKKLRLIRQTESAECGIACLAMIADWYGFKTDLPALRERYHVSQQGLKLSDVIECAKELKLSSRALHASMDDLEKLSLPCVLHWDMNHFVVLNKASNNLYEIYDPASGIRKQTREEIDKHYTGIALELSPTHEFEKGDERKKVRIRDLIGKTIGFKRALSKIFIFAIALEILALLSPLVNQIIIDEVLVTRDQRLLDLVIIALLMLATTQSLVSMARLWFTIYLSVNFNMQWAANVFHHLIGLPIDWFEKRELGDISAKFSSLDTIQHAITNNIIKALIDLILASGTLLVMFLYSPILVIVAISASAAYAIMRFTWFDSFKRAEEDIWSTNAKEQSHFLETLHGMLSVRINGGMSWRENTWRNLNIARRNAQLNESKLSMVYNVIMESLMSLSTAAVLWFGARLVLEGSFTVGMLIAFLSFQGRFSSSVNELINNYFEFKMLTVYTERLADIVLTDKEQSKHSVGFSLSKHPSFTHEKNTVQVDNLSFCYSSNSPVLFDNLSFTIAPGEIVAITGPSGCGKTTLAKLLLGLYQPTKGTVQILGQDITRTNLDDLRGKIGSVFQDDQLFNGSILSNISFFSQHINMERVLECAKLANIHEEIEAMPMGYQTLVGAMGNTVSGGQKQRIIFARALYKQPKLLILDEATSHLDIKNEKDITQAIRKLGLPVIQIAHRPETIATADRIIDLGVHRQGNLREAVA
ncbi:TPA: peptidase domain-containing ABC transporter [Vibrio cholerae]|nr:peptidase domain-containing ABC transporter [Vibrio cholerae]HBK7239528.1 peptidase domain-containing ABC transporter [Vibrio cholerae]